MGDPHSPPELGLSSNDKSFCDAQLVVVYHEKIEVDQEESF